MWLIKVLVQASHDLQQGNHGSRQCYSLQVVRPWVPLGAHTTNRWVANHACCSRRPARLARAGDSVDPADAAMADGFAVLVTCKLKPNLFEGQLFQVASSSFDDRITGAYSAGEQGTPWLEERLPSHCCDREIVRRVQCSSSCSRRQHIIGACNKW